MSAPTACPSCQRCPFCGIVYHYLKAHIAAMRRFHPEGHDEWWIVEAAQ